MYTTSQSKNIFYVYIHTRLGSGEVFYVGKGTGNRLYESYKRNIHWKRIVKIDGGFNAIIVMDNLNEADAFDLEMQLISEIGLGNLSNQTIGGSGGNTRKNYTPDRYSEFIKRKSEAQSGKIGHWRGKRRDDMIEKIRAKHISGSYNYDWLKAPKSVEHKHKLSSAAFSRIRPLVNCELCGKLLPNTHVNRHKISRQCIN